MAFLFHWQVHLCVVAATAGTCLCCYDLASLGLDMDSKTSGFPGMQQALYVALWTQQLLGSKPLQGEDSHCWTVHTVLWKPIE